MTEALVSKTCTPCRGGVPPSRASKLSSFTHRPQTGNCQRKLTASSGASGFAISERRLPLSWKLSELAEAEGHHPNVSFGWGNASDHMGGVGGTRGRIHETSCSVVISARRE
jgi:4a-hydroxytetrahydrobiopterin dehydratase